MSVQKLNIPAFAMKLFQN